MTPAEPKPASSVLLVRAGSQVAGRDSRRSAGRKNALLLAATRFPAARWDPEDGAPDILARCRGLTGDRGRTGSSPRARQCRRWPSGWRPFASCWKRPALAASRREDVRSPSAPPTRRGSRPSRGSHGEARAARRAPRLRGLVPRSRPLPLPLALHHAALEPHSLQRALLSRSGSHGPEPAPLPRGGLGELLGRAGRGLSPSPERGVGHGRAGRYGRGYLAQFGDARRGLAGPRGRPACFTGRTDRR